MFTGIIQSVGEIAKIEHGADSVRLRIVTTEFDLSDVQLGDSIAVSGPCLTVVDFDDTDFSVDVSPETLACTTLGERAEGDAVNLEKALRLADRLSGHLVSGHVDGVGEILARETLENYVQFRIRAPQALARYIATKGSICVDGISLTVNAVNDADFDILIIPHTLDNTSLGACRNGAHVNLEVDLIARYLERMIDAGNGIVTNVPHDK